MSNVKRQTSNVKRGTGISILDFGCWILDACKILDIEQGILNVENDPRNYRIIQTINLKSRKAG
jgi:hypothetical protein